MARKAARDDEDDYRETPPVVVGAVSVGTVPLPFLAVYAVLFILHGWVRPVHPPDITSTQDGELVAGLIAAAAFIVVTYALVQFLNTRRRWPFALTQLVILGVSVWFLLDDTKGGSAISTLVLVACVVSLALGFAPSSWRHLGKTPPRIIARMYGLFPTGGSSPAGSDAQALPRSSEPTLVPPASLRRRKSSTSG